MRKMLLILVIAGLAFASPKFTDYESISPKDGTSSWTPSGTKCGSPNRVDWNNDGVLDIIYGYMNTPSGNGMNIFINSGSNTNPVYDDPITKSYPITGV